MPNKFRLYLIIFLLLNFKLSTAQHPDSVNSGRFNWKQYIIPTALVGYGVVSICNSNLERFNYDVKKSICGEGYFTRTKIDNYTQYAPGLAALGLNAAGIKGKSKFGDLAVICTLSNLIATTIVCSTKRLTHQERPDKSAFNSFPSGHTAAAFAGAELLFQEYKDKSIWYGVAGYACAAATGYFRMYNNRHSLSDVMAGAGIGIISTKLAYFSYSKIKKIFSKNKSVNTVVVPVIQGNMQAVAFIHTF